MKQALTTKTHQCEQLESKYEKYVRESQRNNESTAEENEAMARRIKGLEANVRKLTEQT